MKGWMSGSEDHLIQSDVSFVPVCVMPLPAFL